MSNVWFVTGAGQKPEGHITEVSYMFPKPGADPRPVPKVAVWFAASAITSRPRSIASDLRGAEVRRPCQLIASREQLRSTACIPQALRVGRGRFNVCLPPR